MLPTGSEPWASALRLSVKTVWGDNHRRGPWGSQMSHLQVRRWRLLLALRSRPHLRVWEEGCRGGLGVSFCCPCRGPLPSSTCLSQLFPPSGPNPILGAMGRIHQREVVSV